MDSDVGATFRNLVASELQNELGRIHAAVGQINGAAAAKGYFDSGRRIVQVSGPFVEGIQRHREFVFRAWADYLRPRLLVQQQNADAGIIATAATDAFDESIAVIQRRHHEVLQSPRGGFESAVRSVQDSFAAKVSTERSLLAANTKLYATTPTPPVHPHINVTTTGANSPVNVGSGTQTQSVVTVDMRGLVEALDKLVAAIDQRGSSDTAELREVVVAAMDEAGKRTPNRLKLASYLGGVASGVHTVAAIEPAWQVVKKIAESLGLM